MGLFYTALERANQAAAKTPEEEVAPAAEPLPVTTWQDAAQRDFAGYPLEEAADTPGVALPEGTAPLRAIQFDASRLHLGASEAGVVREQYRILRTRVLEAMRRLRRHSLLITSAGAGEGKTTVAINLALQLSSLKEVQVLLIDADLRRAGLTAGLCPAPQAGLGHLLKGEATLEGQLYAVDPWLTVLPTLCAQEEAAELLAGHRMTTLLQTLCGQFDLVLLDSSPVGPVADSRILARLVEASLLVVRQGGAPTADIEQAAALLRPTLLGSVFNGAEERRGGKGYPYGAEVLNQSLSAKATS